MKLADKQIIKAIGLSVDELWADCRKELLDLRDAIDIMEKDEYYTKESK